jgi:TPP-dependent pyruvate/acetoin dehydrogenase alpha subunit
MALAEKRKRSQAVTIAFLGDGTLGEGVLYEALNLAALWEAPILYVLENNRIAQTTPIELAVAGSLPARFEAFGIPACELDSSDVQEILPLAKGLLDNVRLNSKPGALILHTHRFGPHSKGDDTRPPEQIARLQIERDPLTIHGKRLDASERAQIEALASAEIANAFQRAMEDPATPPMEEEYKSVGVQR